MLTALIQGWQVLMGKNNPFLLTLLILEKKDRRCELCSSGPQREPLIPEAA